MDVLIPQKTMYWIFWICLKMRPNNLGICYFYVRSISSVILVPSISYLFDSNLGDPQGKVKSTMTRFTLVLTEQGTYLVQYTRNYSDYGLIMAHELIKMEYDPSCQKPL